MRLVDLASEKKAADFQQVLEQILDEKAGIALDACKSLIAADMFESIGHIKKGAFHVWLGKSEDEPITDADIKKGLKAGGHAAKMANFARNFGHKK